MHEPHTSAILEYEAHWRSSPLLLVKRNNTLVIWALRDKCLEERHEKPNLFIKLDLFETFETYISCCRNVFCASMLFSVSLKNIHSDRFVVVVVYRKITTPDLHYCSDQFWDQFSQQSPWKPKESKRHDPAVRMSTSVLGVSRLDMLFADTVSPSGRITLRKFEERTCV